MKTRQPALLLLHPLFIVSLIILLANDFYLKYQYSNWLTGKLSDFAGIFVFSVFLIAIFPANKNRIAVFVALFFIWWKSSLSEPAISFFNQAFSIPLIRTIDYSDLLSLVVLPLSVRLKKPNYAITRLKTVAVYPIGIISLFAFCSTSVAREVIYYPYKENEVRFNEDFVSSLTVQEVLKRLDALHQGYRKDSIRFYKVTENENFYYRINQKDSTEQWLPIANKIDSALYVKRFDNNFYTVSKYVLGKDTLYNLGVTVYANNTKRKMTHIRVVSFESKNDELIDDFYDDDRKKFKKHFRKLFKK